MPNIIQIQDAISNILQVSQNTNIINTDPSQQPYNATEKIDGGTDGDSGKAIRAIGTDSLFNPFQIFRYSAFAKPAADGTTGEYDTSLHKLKYDSSKLRNLVEYEAKRLKDAHLETIQNPTANTLINWANNKAADPSGPTYPYPYSLNDFLWCKWYGKIPNNRLLTLRRYTIPVEDNLQVSAKKLPLVPIAQAVTWFGEGTSNSLASILGMTYGFNWKPINNNEVVDVAGNELIVGKFLEVLGIKDKAAQQKFAVAFANNENNAFTYSGFDETLQQFTKDNWKTGAYWNRVKGPVNVITNTQMRERGYSFEHNISLTFEYSLRSYGNLNPKVAMLDLISNMLALTSNSASFWGGSSRYYKQTGPLLTGFNSSGFEEGDMEKGYKEVTNVLANMLAESGGDIKKFIDSFNNDLSSATDVQGSVTALLKNLADTNAGKAVLSSRASSLYQKPLLLRALLDGRSVGEWHLMVGNPMDPIAVIGNLCLKTTKIELSEELGANDFPTGVKFTISLVPGRDRAKQDIASMFNHGGGDLIHSPLQLPSSAMNTFGEYSSTRLMQASGTSPDAEAMNDPNFKAVKEALTKSNTNIATNVDSETKAENYAKYFGVSVSTKYGANFGKSPILVDYFTKLQTKD